jgi:RNA polymerase sigma factor (sigma-70 family)
MPPRQGPYRDVDSLIRATYEQLGRAAFGCLGNEADAEDAVQTACIKVMRNWSFVGGLATAAQQRAYLHKTVVNETLQIRRRPHRKWEHLGAEAIEEEPSFVPDCPDDHYQDARKKLRLVWEAITNLPDGCREVVSLFAAGYEYREIEVMADDPGHLPNAASGGDCTVVIIDIVALGARHLRDEDRHVIRLAMHEMTQSALAGVWGRCRPEDLGDGLLIVVPPDVATATVLEDLHKALPSALKRHNRVYGASLPIQLRLAVTVGPVASDAAGGISGEAVSAAFRLIEASALKRAVADSRADIGVIVSSFVYDNYIATAPGPVDPAGYHQVWIAEKESSVPAWMQLIEPVRPAPGSPP